MEFLKFAGLAVAFAALGGICLASVVKLIVEHNHPAADKGAH
jgi:hypothetical protein